MIEFFRLVAVFFVASLMAAGVGVVGSALCSVIEDESGFLAAFLFMLLYVSCTVAGFVMVVDTYL